MSRFSELCSTFKKWRDLTESQREHACIETIRQFENKEKGPEQIAELANSLALSGTIWSWTDEIAPVCDVPSTGGMGSLTTLFCPYVLASGGCFVPKLSVPGSVAGAIDVLSLLNGFDIQLSNERMQEILVRARVGHAINTLQMAPADGLLFSLRTKLGKKSIPSLVIASLLSKKIAVSCNTCVLDVRVSENGNLGSDVNSAIENSRVFVEVAECLGINATCVVTDHLTPRMHCFGRGESLSVLHEYLTARNIEEVNPRLQNHLKTCAAIAKVGLNAVGIRESIPSPSILDSLVFNGRTQDTFLHHLQAQGAVDDRVVEQYLEQIKRHNNIVVKSRNHGIMMRYNLRSIASFLRNHNSSNALMLDKIGISILKSIGDTVAPGDPLVRIRVDSTVALSEYDDLEFAARSFYEIGDNHADCDVTDEFVTAVRRDHFGGRNGGI